MRSLEWASVFDTEISNMTKQSALLNSLAFMGGDPKDINQWKSTVRPHVILEPIKVMISRQNSSPYIKNQMRLKICEKEILSYVAIGKLL